ncbi:MAG: TlpA disulfide reductase family protein [Tenuifilaceae bacterium]|nr:TlpA disulfide reductase family protein [Tenuifilaceae bacterium]
MRRTNMLKTLTLLALATIIFSCNSNPKKESVENKKAEIIPIVDFDGAKPLLHKDSDTLYVVNFWATWCAPCVKEIPYFEQIAKEFTNRKLKVILINLDFPNHYESRLIPFVEENGIKSSIVMLDDPDANRWINEVNTGWSGSIPATLIYNRHERRFFEQEFTYDELKNAVTSFDF